LLTPGAAGGLRRKMTQKKEAEIERRASPFDPSPSEFSMDIIIQLVVESRGVYVRPQPWGGRRKAV